METSKRRREKVYREGDWFGVPLPDGRYAPGLVAREGRDVVFLGYFFGPATTELPTLDRLRELTANDTVLVGRLGDLGLEAGELPILMHAENWNPADWPMPMFGHVDVVDANQGLGRTFDESEISPLTTETPISVDRAKSLFPSYLHGDVALAIRLSRILDGL